MKPFKYSTDNNTFIINNPNLPKQWANYFWSNKGYIARFTHTGSGESYHIDSKANFCSVNNAESRYLYLRDDESNQSWNIGYGPLLEPVENYCCEHSITHSIISSEKHGIRASWRFFVPTEGCCEIWTVQIKNTTEKVREISMFSATTFDLEGFSYPRYHEMYRTLTAKFEPSLNGVFCKSAHEWAPHNKYNAFLSASEEISGFDSNTKKFTGSIGTFSRPQMLLEGKDCTNSSRTCYDLGAILQNKLLIQPGEEKTIHFVLGISESVDEATSLCNHLFIGNTIETIFETTCRTIYEKYTSLNITTPDEKVNQLMNNWVKKQVDFCLVGKKGVRDNAQIASALLMYRPEVAKNEIIEILRHQYQSGNAVLTWLPIDETRYSDQPFWIIWIITELIKETGDFSVLNEMVEYQDGGEGPVMEHLKAAVNRLLEDRGPNGLVRIFFADWNDALNITDDADAESVMLTQQFCLALRELAILCDKTGDMEYAEYLRSKYEEVKKAANTVGWDGDYYARAISKKGNIGSKNSEGSKIYLNPQVWAILARVPDEDKLDKVIKAIDSMEHDFGFPINMPPYTQYTPHIGRMGLMLPGLYENGGVYCHASAFKVMADGVLGRGDEALRTMKKIMPDSEKNPYTQSETEPYVFTNCYSINTDSYGKADRSWITGTSAWCMKGIYEGIMGIYKDYDGLRIEPGFPSNWKEASVIRTFRGCRYNITIQNPENLANGKISITVDDKKVDGNILPLFADNLEHIVIASIYNG
jgi:cellobiose phosphorylase